jgi:phosphohistidine phosphatase SixA
MGKQVLLLLTGMLVLLLISCKKVETRTEVVTVRDTVYVRDTTLIPALVSDTTTTLIILRHAEQASSGNDPGLSSAGMARAAEVVRLLNNVPVAGIYTTPFERTRQTVQPLASAKGINISEYDPGKPYPQLVTEIVAATHGRVAVIVGHSNTVPEILRELSHNSFNITIGEGVYDNLFIVSLPDDLSARITHLKYGEPTP